MPRRALRCCVELSIHAVSAPGVWLPSKEDVYLSISLLDSHRITRLQTSVFPLLIHEQFSFQKTYYSALDPSEVADYLEDEVVVIELLQLSEYRDGAVRLASYSAFARDFLFPFPSLAPTYSSTDRELLLTRSVAFPGISPKLEFATKTVIKESLSPELDALEDALDQERGRRTSRRSRSPARRPRSTSLSRRITDLSLSDSVDSRPPFVVRKLETDLIGRVPGGGPDAHGKSRGRKPKSLSASKSDTCMHTTRLCVLCRHSLRQFGTLYPGHTQYYHENSVRFSPTLSSSAMKCSLCDALNQRCSPAGYRSCSYRPSSAEERYGRFSSPYQKQDKSKFDSLEDEDAEVSALTSRPLSSYSRPRPRSASPVLARPSFRARYGLSPYYPYYPYYSSAYADYLKRRAEDYRLARLTDPLYPYYPYYSPYRRYYYDTLLDLELSTSLAKSRRYLY